MENKKNIDAIFKDKVQQIEIEPSQIVWENVEDALGYKKSITARRNFAYIQAAIIGCSFIILLLLFIPAQRNYTARFYKQINTHEFNSGSKEISGRKHTLFSESVNNTIPTFQLITDKSASTQVSGSVTSISQKNILPAKNLIAREYIRSIEKSNTFPVTPLLNKNNQLINTVNNTGNVVNTTLVAENNIAEKIKPESLRIDKEKEIKQFFYNLDTYDAKIHLKGFSLGLTGAFNQTSLLENNTMFDDAKPIHTSPKFAPSKGFCITYNFSNNFGLQANYFYNSVQGQNYILPEGGSDIQKSISIYYDEIPFVAEYKIPKISSITNKPVVTNIIAGIQYSKLRDYRLPQEKRIGQTENVFKPDAIAFIAGIDYDVFINDKTYITLGARGAISNDISTHSYPFDSDTKRSFVFGIRGSINYMFRNY